MSLGRDDVEKLAELARIRIKESEIPEVAQRLNAILEMVDEMSEIDTENVQPMSHPLDTKQRLRADSITEIDQREAFQKVAPSADAGLYLVPRVVE